MLKIKRMVSGILAALTISGVVSGCKNNNTQDKTAETKEPYVIELPIVGSIKEEQELETLIEKVNSEGAMRVLYDDYILVIGDIVKTEVDYELLNKIIDLFGRINEDKTIMYFPASINNINFDNLNVEDSELEITIADGNVDLANIKRAIEKNPTTNISVYYFEEQQVSELLELFKLISDNNGEVTIQTYTKVSDEAFKKLLEGIQRDWHFSRFSIGAYQDFTSYVSKFNADTLTLDVSFLEESNKMQVAEGVKYFYINSYLPREKEFALKVSLPDSLKAIDINYDYIDRVIIDDIKNASLRARTSEIEKLNTFVTLGYFDYPDFRIVAGDYVFDKNYYFTDGQIEVSREGTDLGIAQLERDSDGNIEKIIITDKVMSQELAKHLKRTRNS